MKQNQGGKILRHLVLHIEEGFPSGQREQTVNLPAVAFAGSNPAPSTSLEIGTRLLPACYEAGRRSGQEKLWLSKSYYSDTRFLTANFC